MFYGDVIDACAAPGNKTTHLAALLSSETGDFRSGVRNRKIIACERDGPRSDTLKKMVKLAGASEAVHIKARQDFLQLDFDSPEFANVTAILLDPSCSGSGIVGRDEFMVEVHLPKVDRAEETNKNSKKRKRNGITDASNRIPPPNAEAESISPDLEADSSKLTTRLSALSSFQLRLLEHAMAFPTVTRITYSTCSLYKEENEYVVMKALCSDTATKRKWKFMTREEQVEGLRKWHRRGDLEAVMEISQTLSESGIDVDHAVVADACIRCDKASEDGTMGFFVVAFTREPEGADIGDEMYHNEQGDVMEEAEWVGFGDDSEEE